MTPPGGALDDEAALEAVDRGGMLRTLASGGAQVRQAAVLTAEAGLAEALRGAGRPRSVLVTGPDALGALVAGVCGTGCPIPVLPVSGPTLPGWIGTADLLFAVGARSFDLAAQAVRRGTAVVCVGPAESRLRSLAEQNRLLYVPLPPGGPERALLWAQLVPVLMVLDGLGVAPLPETAIEAAAARLEEVAHRCRPGGEPFVNPAKQLALDLAEALPMPWGEGPLAEAAAERLAAQLGDNAQVPVARALAGSLDAAPSLGDPDDFFRDRGEETGLPLHLLALVDGRRPVVADAARARGIAVDELVAEGAHPLERAASLVAMCDYVSVYLALSLGVDPAPVPARAEIEARTT